MFVTINEESFRTENNEKGIGEINRRIENYSRNTGYILKHMVVDGISVYDNHNSYLQCNLTDIQNVEVVMTSVATLVTEMVITAHDYLQRAIPQILPIIDALYAGHPSADTIDGIGQLLEGGQWVIAVIDGMQMQAAAGNQLFSNSSITDCVHQRDRLMEELPNLKDAIHNMDEILIADIIRYEVLDALQNIQRSFTAILSYKESDC